MKLTAPSFAFAAALLFCGTAMAITVSTVPIGNAGNAADKRYSQTGYGKVDYAYRIAATEVTNSQYVEFLNAVAAADPYGLFDQSMNAKTYGGIVRTGTSGSFQYSVKPPDLGGSYAYDNKPVVYVSWYDALRFANWLNNGQPIGAEGNGTTENGAYTFSGLTTVSARNLSASWGLPSENEWYKAAYYDPVTSTYFDYPTGTNNPPNNNPPTADTGNSANYELNGTFATGLSQYPMTDVGAYALSASPYGTFDQGGNAFEWVGSSPGRLRGGVWGDDVTYLNAGFGGSIPATDNVSGVGFRVVAFSVNASQGDFNGDGVVDAADYVVWRNSNGSTVDYNVWRANFGHVLSGNGSAFEAMSQVPEPATAVLVLLAMVSCIFRGRR